MLNIDVRVAESKSPYLAEGAKVVACSTLSMLSDKLQVLATHKVCRRIKDLYDVYVLCHLADYNLYEIKNEIIMSTEPILFEGGVYVLNPASIEYLKHAYDRYTGIAHKVPFEEMYAVVVSFTTPIYEAMILNTRNQYWGSKYLRWDINVAL